MKLVYQESTKSVSIEDCKELAELSFCSSHLTAEELLQRVEIIVNNVLKHPDALTAVQDALKDGKIVVMFEDHQKMRSTASWNGSLRHISMNKDEKDQDEILDGFIFEICNANNKAFKDISVQNSKDVDDFVLKMETAEHATHNAAAQIMQSGYTTAGWPKSSENNIRKAETLDTYLLKAHAPASHGAYHGFTHASQYKHQYFKIKLPIYEIQIKSLQDLILTMKTFLPNRDAYYSPADTALRSVEFNRSHLEKMKAMVEKFRLDCPNMTASMEIENKKIIEQCEALLQQSQENYKKMFDECTQAYEKNYSMVSSVITEKEQELKELQSQHQIATEALLKLNQNAQLEIKGKDENRSIENIISEKAKVIPPLMLELKMLMQTLGEEKWSSQRDNLVIVGQATLKMQQMLSNPETIDRKQVLELIETIEREAKAIIKNLKEISQADSMAQEPILTAYSLSMTAGTAVEEPETLTSVAVAKSAASV